jgi:hypothetical protein
MKMIIIIMTSKNVIILVVIMSLSRHYKLFENKIK